VWVDDLAEIRAGGGASLTRKMREALDVKLGEVAQLRGTVWWAQRHKLETIAKKFHGDDPEDVVEWVSLRDEKVPIQNDFKANDFIQGYCQSSYSMIRDPLLADAIFISYCKFMMHWMLNEQATVDLWFAKMDALCLRRNWAGVVAGEEMQKRARTKIYKNEFLKPDQNSMVKRGVADFLITPYVTQMDSWSDTATYTVDVRLGVEWDKVVRALEREKKSVYKGGYAQKMRDTLKRQLPRVLEAYEYFLREVARPVFPVPDGIIGGKPSRFRKKRDRERKSAVTPCAENISVPGVGENVSDSVEMEDQGVSSEVPDLQPEDKDMRNAREESDGES
jgi:hypothetical protein